MKKLAESDSHISLQNLQDLQDRAEELLELIHPGDDLEDWIDVKIGIAQENIEGIKNYIEYHKNEKDPMIPEIIEDEDGSEYHYVESSFEDDDGFGDRFFLKESSDHVMASVLYKAKRIAKKSKRPKGKKWKHTYTDSKTGKKKTVWHGDNTEKTSPGTPRGDSYCARSYGIMKDHNKDCSGKDKNTPNCLSRKRWKCRGKKSMK